MYDFIILTTAVTRPDLHSQVFPKNLNFFNGCHIKWLINIDSINNQFSINDTIENFRNIFSKQKNIEIEFLSTEENSCFFSATKNLVSTAYRNLEDCKTGVIWLEDDWIITPKNFCSQFLSNLRISRTKNVLPCRGNLKQKQLYIEAMNYSEDKLWFISLAPRIRVSFNPGIWSKEMFVQGLYRKLTAIQVNQIDDPETLCADPFNINPDFYKITFLIDPIFQDAGRRWAAQAKVEKWDKNQSSELESRNFTYDNKSTESPLAANKADNLTGFFVFSIPFFNLPIKFIAETKRIGDGVISAQLLAIPFATLELRVNEIYKTDVYINKIHSWARAQPFDKLPARIAWNFIPNSEELYSVELIFMNKNFTAEYTKKFPLCFIWVPSIQFFIGIAYYMITLIKITTKLVK